MDSKQLGFSQHDVSHADTVGEALKRTHRSIQQQAPEIVRLAFASYDASYGTLRTFAHSTVIGRPLRHYSAPINADSSLGKSIARQTSRVLNDIPSQVTDTNGHSHWLLEQGYQASLSQPVYDNDQFLGVLFFDASQPHYFDSVSQEALIDYSAPLMTTITTQRRCINAMSDLGHSLRHTSFEHPDESQDHAYRVGQFAQLIGQHLAELYQLDDETLDHIVQFAQLHDIGKYSVLGSTQQSLWLEDWGNHLQLTAQIQHGLNLVNDLARQVHQQQHTCLQLLRDIIQYHHEYLDGSGAPNGLSHAQIPVSARIVTVANIFDALTSHRYYSESWSLTHALLELEKMVATGKIDGNCVQALRAQQDSVRQVMQSVHLPRM
ncbi:HD-GYP domain-containing protein [Vibrio sp. 10N]|uniref:HD-GYP domain-containing protein n=1 Tax=Vibrio sp. 10N TaxID=3058938 RepID=UPI002813D54B|nr:HD-GYP domain-containing protein [Vibrio sp. 10N]